MYNGWAKDKIFLEVIRTKDEEKSTCSVICEGDKYTALKTKSESDIALLENDKKHLTEQVKSQEDRIKDLEARLKDVPTQIAEAVKASRSDITVNQDSGKK